MASRTTYALVLILLLVVAGLAYESQAAHQSKVGTSSKTSSSSAQAVSPDWLAADPSFVGTNATIDYPPDYDSMAAYTLGLINTDRQSAGAPTVELSSVPSGQQHADSLSYFGTTGHWDVQGYKPYMRYTLLGGTGYMAENVAQGYCTSSQPSAPTLVSAKCTTQTIENGLAAAEYQMMNDDAACCGNGHKENIVDKAHNSVSLGVAYNTTSRAVYLVEDFQDSFIQNGSIQLTGTNVTISGTTNADLTGWTANAAASDIVVYHDPAPSAIPVSELAPSQSCDQNELKEPAPCQYLGAYSAGTQVADVLAPCPTKYKCGTGNFTFAATWAQDASSGSFEIVVPLAQLESTYGGGVYTFYLWPDGDLTEPITGLSVFATGA